jgi:hypothetical protein
MNFLQHFALQGKKLDDSLRLNVAEIVSHLTWFLSASVTRKALHSTNEQTPLSNNTINSILWNWEAGRAKDFSAPPRMV